MQLTSRDRTPTNASQTLEHDHHVIDDHLAAFIEAATRGQIERDTLDEALSRLRRHIWVEEEVLFPPLREAGVAGPVMVMLREHGEIWRAMDELDQVLLAGNPDLGAADTVSQALDQVLAKHNYKEEAIVYATAERVLDAAIVNDVQTALAGPMPAGWACAMAAR